jgi:hypothetical protein
VDSSASNDAVVALAIPFLYANTPCTTVCFDPGDCENGQHWAWDYDDANEDIGEPHSQMPPAGCRSNTCEIAGHTGICEGKELDLEGVRLAVLEGDAAGVRAFLDVAKGKAELNFGRNALQLFDCKGNVAAHLPLTEKMLGELAQ